MDGFGVDMRLGGWVYLQYQRRMIDPIARRCVRTFALPSPFGNLVVPDSTLNRVFYQTSNTIRASTSVAEPGRERDSAQHHWHAGQLDPLGGEGACVSHAPTGQIYMVESTSWIP